MEDRFKKFEFQEAETGSKPLLHQVQEGMLSRRKERVNQILMEKRNIISSNQNQIHQNMDTEEVQEEFLNQEKKSLPMNHFKKYWRKTKGKRCWYCYSWGHLKNRCPYIKCFYCGFKGHTKKFCFKLDLHRAIQALRDRTTREEANDNKKERSKHL